MARLRDGEKGQITQHIQYVVGRHDQGLTEQQLEELTGMDRRRLNNYLRELQQENKIYREGRAWYPG